MANTDILGTKLKLTCYNCCQNRSVIFLGFVVKKHSSTHKQYLISRDTWPRNLYFFFASALTHSDIKNSRVCPLFVGQNFITWFYGFIRRYFLNMISLYHVRIIPCHIVYELNTCLRERKKSSLLLYLFTRVFNFVLFRRANAIKFDLITVQPLSHRCGHDCF